MTLKKCDRCKKLYEYVYGCKKELKYQLKEKVPEKLSDARVIDLCPACYEELTSWIEKCEV